MEIERLRQFQIPGLVVFESGEGGLPRARIETKQSRGEVYLQGAQVTAFQTLGDPPLLYLSQASQFAPGIAFRGGVPICYPWFGPRAGNVAHGFARITEWEVVEVAALPGGGASLRFRLPKTGPAAEFPDLAAEYTVTMTDKLALQLIVTNESADREREFEACLHTYLAVADVTQIAIHGLEDTLFLDKMQNPPPEQRAPGPIRIRSQTDRTYLDTASTVVVHDPVLRREIRVEKSGSMSTVVWNPWTTQVLSDLGPAEYKGMVCVESGNVDRNRVTLWPGKRSELKVVLSSTTYR
jgi:D-hexose-6-phosphate mutarotase